MIAQDFLLDSDPAGTYLVWALNSKSRVISYQMEVLIRNRPPYLLPCFLRFHQGQQQICQDISGLFSLDAASQDQDLHPERGREILLELINDLTDAADHLLPANQISLIPSTIFLDANRKLVLAFWPVCRGDKSGAADCSELQELQELLHILGRAFHLPAAEIAAWCEQLSKGGLEKLQEQLANQHSGAEEQTNLSASSDYRGNGSRINDYLCSHISAAKKIKSLTKLFCLFFLHVICLAGYLTGIRNGETWSLTVKAIFLLLLLFLLLIDIRQVQALRLKRNHHDTQCPSNSQLKKASATAAEKPEAPATIGTFVKQLIVQATGYLNTIGKALRQGLNPEPDLSPDPGGQTVFHSTNPDDFRMALLSEGRPGTLAENEGIRAYILVDEFIIGRDQKNCDLYLENLEIGRQHARILRREGSFFLCDLGSRNGSTVDGRRIMKNTETLLPDQCLIKFADRQFYFQAD